MNLPVQRIDLIQAASLPGHHGQRDLRLAQDKVAEIAPALAPRAGEQAINLDGRVLLPGLVDIHTHLDKTFSTTRNASGTLGEAISVWLSAHQFHTRDSVYSRARAGLERALMHGTTAIRTHVDVVTPAHLESVEALLQLKDELKARIDLQLVALGYPGRGGEYYRLMELALKMGVDLVGGVPVIDAGPEASLRACFALSEHSGKALDLHIDETEDPAARSLALYAEMACAHGMQGRVTAGHCVSLTFMPDAEAARIIDLCANARMTVVTLPSCNLVLMGRAQQPTPRGLTRVKDLLAAGITLCAASDNVRDPFNPFGDYDVLHIGNLAAHCAHMSSDAERAQSLDLVTSNPARAFYGEETAGRIEVGARADFVVLDASDPGDAIAAIPRRMMTIKAGMRVA